MSGFENTVPPWAAQEEPLKIDPAQIPRYFRPATAAPRPQFLESRGRWNSVMNASRTFHMGGPVVNGGNGGPGQTYYDTEAYPGSSANSTFGFNMYSKEVDTGILSEYNLQGKWVNTLTDSDDVYQSRKGLHGLIHGLITDPGFRAKWAYSLFYANPFLPIVFRGSAIVFGIITLGVACSVYVKLRHWVVPGVIHPEMPPLMTIIVSTVSVAYLSFSLYDESFGQPLGLRRSLSKMKFIAGDIMLMCVMASNLAVAMDSIITKPYICPGLSTMPRVCDRQRTVTGFIFMTLIVWMATVCLSVFRMVDRATH